MYIIGRNIWIFVFNPGDRQQQVSSLGKWPFAIGLMQELGLDLRLGFGLKGRKKMFYLTMHSTHFIYGYMASDIW